MVALQSIREKRSEILKIAERYGAHDVRVFGSFARGDANGDSDLDLIVRLDPDRSLFDLGGLVMDLRDLLGMKVDVVTDGSLYGRFGQIVSKEAVPL
jgi:hypothetical protein